MFWIKFLFLFLLLLPHLLSTELIFPQEPQIVFTEEVPCELNRSFQRGEISTEFLTAQHPHPPPCLRASTPWITACSYACNIRDLGFSCRPEDFNLCRIYNTNVHSLFEIYDFLKTFVNEMGLTPCLKSLYCGDLIKITNWYPFYRSIFQSTSRSYYYHAPSSHHLQKSNLHGW